MEEIDNKKLIEAALFMSQTALGVNELMSSTGIMSPGIVERLAKQLVEDYKASNSAMQVLELNGKYMFSLKEPYASKVSGLASGPDISRGALRILAYISKNDGVLQSSIVKLFGESTYAYMKELVDSEFIDAKKKGRTKEIHTTQKFKEYFNV